MGPYSVTGGILPLVKSKGGILEPFSEKMNVLLFLSKNLWIVNVSQRVHVVPVRYGQRKVLRCQCNTDVTWYISSLTLHVATMSNQYAENTNHPFCFVFKMKHPFDFDLMRLRVWVKWLGASDAIVSINCFWTQRGRGVDWSGLILEEYVSVIT